MDTEQDTLTGSANDLDTLQVYIVISGPRLPQWLLKIPGSQLLNSINTTHWGVKTGPSYHDLKMQGLYKTKPDIVFAASVMERDERAVSRTIPIGHTHLDIYQVGDFTKHRVKHVPLYNFWFDNCQRCEHVAKHILCRNCHNEESRSAEENFIALQDLPASRHLDRMLLVLGLGLNLFQWGRDSERDYTIFIISLGLAIYSQFIMTNYQNTFHREQDEENRMFSQMVLEAAKGDRELEELRKNFIQSRPPTVVRKNKPSIGRFHYGSIAGLIWCYRTGACGAMSRLEFASAICCVGFPIAFEAYLVSTEVPREGRAPVGSHCEECSKLLLVVHSKYKRCQQLHSSAEAPSTGHYRRSFIQILLSPSEEDVINFLIRSSVALIILVSMKSYNLNVHLGAQVLLNNVAPVTDWSNGMREVWRTFWFIDLLVQLFYGDNNPFLEVFLVFIVPLGFLCRQEMTKVSSL